MKKILLAIVALFAVMAAFAQADLTSPARNFDPYWFGGVRTGFAQLNGDISNKSFFAKINKESKPSWGITFGRQISPAFSLNVSFSNSAYFSKGECYWAKDTVKNINLAKRDLSVSGKISEFALSGTLNINKLFDKNSGYNWYAYISGGVAITGWHCKLRDDLSAGDTVLAKVENAKYFNVTLPQNSSRIGFFNRLASTVAMGAHFQLTDKIGLELEHALLFSGSSLIDGYNGGTTDIINTTTLGIVINLQKDKSPQTKSPKNQTKATPNAKSEKENRVVRLRRGASKTPPEITEYTGYNALVPPPLPKVDTNLKIKKGTANSGKNNWVAEADSGQLQITGSGKVKNEVYTSPEPQVTSDLKNGSIPSYRVQIEASKTYIQIAAVIKKFALKEKVSVELRSDGWYRYYVGQFDSLSEARAGLAAMRAKGVKDAFIVALSATSRKVIK